MTCYEIASAYECGRFAGLEICYEIESVSEEGSDVPPRRLQRRYGAPPMGFDFDLLLLLDGLVGWIPGWGTHYYACEERSAPGRETYYYEQIDMCDLFGLGPARPYGVALAVCEAIPRNPIPLGEIADIRESLLRS